MLAKATFRFSRRVFRVAKSLQKNSGRPVVFVPANEKHNQAKSAPELRVDDEEATQVREVTESDLRATAGELEVKRKMSPYATMYGKLMNEVAPEDEKAILEHYVRKAQENLEELDTIEYHGIVDADKELFFKMVDLWIQDAGEVRRGHREFIQVALNNLERFNVQHEPKAYLKVLECYPTSKHTGLQRNNWFNAVWQDKIVDHELGVRLFTMIRKYDVVPNDELYDVCKKLFGVFSRASASMRSLMFWYPRLTNFVPHPLSEIELEKMSRTEIVLHGLRQAVPGLDASYQRFEVDSSNRNEFERKTRNSKLDCVISLQTYDQKEMLKNHDLSKPVYVEGPFLMYLKSRSIKYYILRGDAVEQKTTETSHQLLTDREWWVKFYGRDFETKKALKEDQKLYSSDSFLPAINLKENDSVVADRKSRNEIIQVSGDTSTVEGSVYAVAGADIESLDALRSWVCGLEPTNPVLSQLTVLFNNKTSFLAEGYKRRKS